LQRAEPVIPTVGESLANTEIFRRLARRFGFDEPAFHDTDAELMDAAFEPTDPRLEGYRPSEIPTDTALLMGTEQGDELIMCQNLRPRTPSGKIELFSQTLEDRYGYGVPRYEPVRGEYPFMVVSPSSSKRTNATFGGDPASAGPEVVEIHPADAAEKTIADGDPVRVWNGQGEVVLRARVTDAVRPKVLYSAKGTWLYTSTTGLTVNSLISADAKTDIMDGACYNDTFVDIAPVNGA
jgi:anaerobic selenocysteine-containing dehydrogenase